MVRTEFVPSCDCNPYREGVTVAADARTHALRPSFDNIRGGLAGYAAKDCSPSRQNREAFKTELTELLCFEPDVAPSDWEEVLSEVSEFLCFWKVYYCGIDPEQARL